MSKAIPIAMFVKLFFAKEDFLSGQFELSDGFFGDCILFLLCEQCALDDVVHEVVQTFLVGQNFPVTWQEAFGADVLCKSFPTVFEFRFEDGVSFQS